MSSYKILKEDGFYLLLETGDFLLQDPPILIDVSDSITILENVFINNVYQIDEIAVTESVTVALSTTQISVSENVTLIENTNVLHNIFYVNKSEALSVSENVTFDWPLIILPNETILVSEAVENQSIRYSSRKTTPRWPNGEIVGGRSLIE